MEFSNKLCYVHFQTNCLDFAENGAIGIWQKSKNNLEMIMQTEHYWSHCSKQKYQNRSKEGYMYKMFLFNFIFFT